MIKEVVARRVIHAAYELDHAIDAKEWCRVRAFFSEKVMVNVGIVSGESVEMSADAFVAQIAAFNPADKLSMHTLGNAVVDVAENKAVLRANRYGWNLCEHFQPALYELWGRVRYELVFENDTWKINGFELVKARDAGNIEVSLYCHSSS